MEIQSQGFLIGNAVGQCHQWAGLQPKEITFEGYNPSDEEQAAINSCIGDLERIHDDMQLRNEGATPWSESLQVGDLYVATRVELTSFLPHHDDRSRQSFYVSMGVDRAPGPFREDSPTSEILRVAAIEYWQDEQPYRPPYIAIQNNYRYSYVDFSSEVGQQVLATIAEHVPATAAQLD